MNRVNLICLGVSDMDKSLAFYKGIGFVTYEKENSPPIVFFDNQGSKLELFPIDGLARDIDEENPPKVCGDGFCGITLACNLKSEQEVDDIMEVVVRYGGTVAKKPQIVEWGGYSGYFRDLDGYYWEVAYGDVWEFDENDMLVID